MRKSIRLRRCGLGFFALVFLAKLDAQDKGAPAVASDALYSEPLPQSWPVPPYPAEAIAAGVEGRVVVGFVVTADGKLVDPVVVGNEPVDGRLVEAALAAVRQWSFSAALNAGKPEARALEVPISFTLKGSGGKPGVRRPRDPELAPTTRPKALNAADPDYPDELLPRKLEGEVDFEFEVNPEGKANDVKVKYASDAVFVSAGLAVLHNWQFEPAHQGPLPVAARMESPMEFSTSDAKRMDIITANGITGVVESELDQPPTPIALFGPVYPHAQHLAGEKGEAEVEFTVEESGRTGFVTVLSATQPDFGSALVAAVETWRFKPAQKDGHAARITLHAHHQFEVNESDPDAALVTALKPDGAGVSGAKGLDKKLRPIWRIAPTYPLALKEQKKEGEVKVDFIIDRDGRVRLPRLAADQDESFGWAAVTALSQWVFEAPTRGGEPTAVRVSIPVHFSPPKD